MRVVEIRDTDGLFSAELCGGTHVHRTGELGFVHILRESAVAAGTRRIEAMTGRAAEAHLLEQQDRLARLAERLSTTPADLEERVEALQAEVERLRRQSEQLARLQAGAVAEGLIEGAASIGDARLIVAKVDIGSHDALKDVADRVRERLKPSLLVLAAVIDGKPAFLAAATADLVAGGVHAGNIVREVAKAGGGGGGGRPDMARPARRTPRSSMRPSPPGAAPPPKRSNGAPPGVGLRQEEPVSNHAPRLRPLRRPRGRGGAAGGRPRERDSGGPARRCRRHLRPRRYRADVRRRGARAQGEPPARRQLGIRRLARHAEDSGKVVAIATRSGSLKSRARMARPLPVARKPEGIRWDSAGRRSLGAGRARIYLPALGGALQVLVLVLVAGGFLALAATVAPSREGRGHTPRGDAHADRAGDGFARRKDADLAKRELPARTVTETQRVTLAVPATGKVLVGTARTGGCFNHEPGGPARDTSGRHRAARRAR